MLNHVMLSFIPLFVAIDVFWLLTFVAPWIEGKSKQEVSTTLRQALATALVVSTLFTIVGDLVFRVLGITVNDFKIAGGLLLLVIAITELTTQSGKGQIMNAESWGVVPLGIPLIVGPAVLTTILVLVDQHGVPATIIALVINLLLAWLVLHNARYIIKLTGSEFMLALSKIMAVLLASIAIMMIRRGLEGIILGVL